MLTVIACPDSDFVLLKLGYAYIVGFFTNTSFLYLFSVSITELSEPLCRSTSNGYLCISGITAVLDDSNSTSALKDATKNAMDRLQSMTSCAYSYSVGVVYNVDKKFDWLWPKFCPSNYRWIVHAAIYAV